MTTAATLPDWARPITFNRAKFDELVIYVATKCQNHKLFGAIKLNKILFFADFTAFLRLGAPITGAEYRKLDRGPAPRQLMPARARLLQDGSVELVRGGTALKPSQRVQPKREANLNVFSAPEIAIVDEIIEGLRDMTADEVSDVTHAMAGWQLTTLGERIPYGTAFIPDEPLELSQAEIVAARAIVARRQAVA